MVVTDITGTPEDAAALALLGATAFGTTETQLLQQLFIVLAIR